MTYNKEEMDEIAEHIDGMILSHCTDDGNWGEGSHNITTIDVTLARKQLKYNAARGLLFGVIVKPFYGHG